MLLQVAGVYVPWKGISVGVYKSLFAWTVLWLVYINIFAEYKEYRCTQSPSNANIPPCFLKLVQVFSAFMYTLALLAKFDTAK